MKIPHLSAAVARGAPRLAKAPDCASMMPIGEQPGDREDIAGPSGRLLDEASREARIVRDDVYVANVVKHLRFESRGKRRIHPRAGSIGT
jgi:uracil-DNA glycosylase family 4